MSPEMAVRLEKGIGIGSGAAAWLRMQMNYDLAKLRRDPAYARRRLICRFEAVYSLVEAGNGEVFPLGDLELQAHKGCGEIVRIVFRIGQGARS